MRRLFVQTRKNIQRNGYEGGYGNIRERWMNIEVFSNLSFRNMERIRGSIEECERWKSKIGKRVEKPSIEAEIGLGKAMEIVVFQKNMECKNNEKYRQ